MCGRFVQASAPTLLSEQFDVDEIALESPVPASYNVAPRAEILTVLDREDRRLLTSMRWGLIPSWADSMALGDRMINARAETLMEKAAFRPAFERRRCIIPVDGFYEWRAMPGSKKQPYYIFAVSGAPLAFAGLWESWRDRANPDSPRIRSCTVITTSANTTMQSLHDRMPVILDADDWDRWLAPEIGDPGELQALLTPAADDLLALHPVSPRVNGAGFDDETLIIREDPLTLFP
ncbi:MAG: SOS response-associated peptidase [Acidimicrobiia bacterium]|nr:SOS response-associated peptidase [Acidimicrobiia bacterium]